MIRMGVQNALEEGGHTLVCLADLVPYHTHANAERSFRVTFELAQRLDLDAVIAPMGTISSFLDNDPDLASRLLHLLDTRNTLVMERDVVGYRCITKDSHSGMGECIRYLIEKCGYRRIAFISGSALSKGAQDRESAYFEEMAAHGLDVPQGCFVRGDFSGFCQDVVERLVDEHPDVEAIACASDQIAFVLYKVMRERRLEVGVDIAVTGFDDHVDSEHMDPPLATVRMTGYDFGCMAAREALRMCEGLPQQEATLTGSFLPRESCGKRVVNDLSREVELLSQVPFPQDKIVSILMDATLRMAGSVLSARFRARLSAFVRETHDLFLRHLAQPDEDVELFSSLSLAGIVSQEYRDFISLEGFHTAVISLLRALEKIYPEQGVWLTEQASLMHLHVARLLDAIIKREVLGNHLREWRTLHLTEDALREDARPKEAYRLMLSDLSSIGVKWAELFLLTNAVETLGTESLALTDTLWHVGSLCDGATSVKEVTPVSLRELMGFCLGRHSDTRLCAAGGILAGDELMGVLVLDGGSLDDNGQAIAMINMGHALKHLQTMASIRVMNEVLSRNNLQLAHQSQRDEMTGLLNRRGLYDLALRTMRRNVGHMAALLFVDMDGLKYVNDTFGHEAGDEAILAITRVLKDSLSSNCLIARLGGDEFVAFCLVDDEGESQDLVCSVEAGLARANASKDDQAMPYELAMSIGVTCFAITDDPQTEFARALMQADERMYAIKQQHRKKKGYHGRET